MDTSPFRYTPKDIAAKRAYRAENPVPRSPWTAGELPEGGIGAVHLVPPETLVSFFSGCIAQLQSLKCGQVGDYLEFGVFNGSSIGSMHIARAQMEAVDQMRLFGFDAFQGLPPGAENDDGGVWKSGWYACSFEDMQQCLRDRNINPDDMHWVKGWYNETLTPSLAKQFNMNNIGIVMVDCDIYSSSKTVLDFIAPQINTPVILCFDDWKLNDVDLNEDGEYRAFNEMLEAHPELEARKIPSYNRKSQSFVVQPLGWEPYLPPLG